jgi:RNA polymerase sigma-70 factor (ECF subfamily)
MLDAAGNAMAEPQALTDHESERFAALVEEHAVLVFSISLSILRNRAEAEDAAQETFLRLIRYRYRLALALDKRAFIARAAQRAALDRLRQQRTTEELHEDSAMTTPQDKSDEAMERAQLVYAIRSLPAELRSVLELAQSGELNSEEMGRVLKIPAATVRSRLARAKSLLREKLERRALGIR